MNKTVALLTAASLVLASAGTALTQEGSKGYLFDKNVCRGWYCYESPPVEPELPNLTPNLAIPPLTLPEAVQAQKKPFTGTVDWEAVWSIPAKELSTMIDDAQSWAEQNPAEQERMLTYLKLQGVAMRRAKRFQESWSEALLKYPLLDETTQRAPTLLGSRIDAISERKDRERIIGEEMRGSMGLVYFYSPTCTYCQKQGPILQAFIEKWKWENFTAINIAENPLVVEQYGIQSVPDLWVVGNVKNSVEQRRIKSGLVDMATLERGLLNAWSMWFRGKPYDSPETVQNLEGFEDFVKKQAVQQQALPSAPQSGQR